jgi:hypothetical protein
MSTTKRMSLNDFKVSKFENLGAIENFTGGASLVQQATQTALAADCHVYNGEPTDNVDLGGGVFLVHADHDYGTF